MCLEFSHSSTASWSCCRGATWPLSPEESLSVSIRSIRVHPCLRLSIPAALGAFAVTSGGGGAPAGGAVEPVQAGISQLFVDDALIAEQHGLRRTLHPPRKDNGG